MNLRTFTVGSGSGWGRGGPPADPRGGPPRPRSGKWGRSPGRRNAAAGTGSGLLGQADVVPGPRVVPAGVVRVHPGEHVLDLGEVDRDRLRRPVPAAVDRVPADHGVGQDVLGVDLQLVLVRLAE